MGHQNLKNRGKRALVKAKYVDGGMRFMGRTDDKLRRSDTYGAICQKHMTHSSIFIGSCTLFCPFLFFFLQKKTFFYVFRGPGAVKQETTSRNTETNSKINFIFGARKSSTSSNYQSGLSPSGRRAKTDGFRTASHASIAPHRAVGFNCKQPLSKAIPCCANTAPH